MIVKVVIEVVVVVALFVGMFYLAHLYEKAKKDGYVDSGYVGEHSHDEKEEK